MEQKKTILVVLVCVSLFIFSGLSLFSCKEDNDTAWENPLGVYSEKISDYYDASIGGVSLTKKGNQSIYVDFSIGIQSALSQPTINNLVKLISGNLQGEQLDWWGLGEEFGGVGQIAYEKNRDFYNKVTSLTSYKTNKAPIEDALKRIISSKNDALLITDFEEYSKNGLEEKSPFAADEFTKWVENGNSIHFYYSNYHPFGKNLYFVIFSFGNIDENSLLTKFQTAIKGRESELIGLKKFVISPRPFLVSNNYGGIEKSVLSIDPDVENSEALVLGNSEEALLSYQNASILEENSRPFEAFEFGQSLNDLYEFYFKGKRRFARNLKLNVKNDSIYSLNNLKVQVVNVTSDYVKFIKYKEASKNAPILEKDDGNNNVWSKTDSEDPIIIDSYIKNTNKLKKDLVYKYSPGEPLEELFDFDKGVFIDRLRNTPSDIELITTFHKNFNGKFNSAEAQILRLDYLVETVDVKITPKLDDFKWKSVIDKGRSENSSLKESIIQTLNNVKPKGIIYSYFLKLEPNSNK
jgi:hypothetical protein